MVYPYFRTEIPVGGGADTDGGAACDEREVFSPSGARVAWVYLGIEAAGEGSSAPGGRRHSRAA